MIYKWEELREEEFAPVIEKCGGLCILPIGCMEVHGEHLPAGCDYYECMAYVEEAARREDVCVFPTGFWLGDVGGARNHKNPTKNHMEGFICLSPELRMNILHELCDEIARNGFCKILIVNCHGGNVGWLNHFLNAHAYKRKDYATMWTWAPDFKREDVKSLYDIVKADPERFSYLTEEDMEALRKFAERGAGGGHGHINETAVLQTVVPHLVKVERSAEVGGLSTHRADYLTKEGVNAQFAWPSNFPRAFNGYDSLGSSANIGRAMVDVSAERLSRIFKILKEDEDCVKMTRELVGLDI